MTPSVKGSKTTRFKIRKRVGSTRTEAFRGHKKCRNCKYLIKFRKRGGNYYLECKDCHRFYGYIKDDKGLNHYRQVVASEGFITF